MKKRLFLLTMTGLLAFGPCAFATQIKNIPRLVVGMDAAYPPFGSFDPKTQTIVGFDVDVIKAIAKKEDFEVEVRNLAFDGLIPALMAGSIDIAINDITITEDRSRSVDFSKRYYIAGLGVVIQSNNTQIKTAKDLEGKRLAVSIGSTGEEAARGIKNADVRVFNQLNECYLELINGGVDAVVNDIPTNDFYVSTNGKGKVKSLPVALTEEDLGIAVKKGNRKLLDKINQGLEKIKKSGEFTTIYSKWFGREPSNSLIKD